MLVVLAEVFISEEIFNGPLSDPTGESGSDADNNVVGELRRNIVISRVIISFPSLTVHVDCELSMWGTLLRVLVDSLRELEDVFVILKHALDMRIECSVFEVHVLQVVAENVNVRPIVEFFEEALVLTFIYCA